MLRNPERVRQWLDTPPAQRKVVLLKEIDSTIWDAVVDALRMIEQQADGRAVFPRSKLGVIHNIAKRALESAGVKP